MNFKKKFEQSMGNQTKSITSRPSPSISEDINTILGKETSFKGVLTYEGTVKIDGNVEGEIIAKDTLIIGEDAEINAEIKVGRLISRGKIKGNITVKERAEFLAPAVLHGNIQTPVIVIEDGVIFEGKCDMGSTEKKPDLKITPLLQDTVKKAKAGE
jgi:cytoskeletal protein CcmA (bactofilin family)